MFKLDIDDKDIIMEVVAETPVTKKDIITNFVGNLLTRAGGDIGAVVKLILTKEYLYLQYIGHAAIGYGEETRNIEKLPLSDIKLFQVSKKDSEEMIRIETETKDYILLRDNSHEDDLALAMSKIMDDMK